MKFKKYWEVTHDEKESNAGEILTGTNVIRDGLTWRFKRHGRQINLWYLK